MTTNIHVNDYMDCVRMIKYLMRSNEIYRDEASSLRAGYNIWRDKADYNNYACFLETRYEVNLPNGDSINIWLDYQKQENE